MMFRKRLEHVPPELREKLLAQIEAAVTCMVEAVEPDFDTKSIDRSRRELILLTEAAKISAVLKLGTTFRAGSSTEE
ncbi:MAG: hypothetical protein E6R03_04750 [Hyphomicrobiaceae bacterium]|nr:MAG: hypothetical protein E6R03_04750 [Hyphomicrobiaceae bacterium]